MATQTAEKLRAREIKPLIGTEILADKQALISGVHSAELREL